MTRRRLALPVVPLSWRTPVTLVLVTLTAAALIVNAIVATPTVGPQPVDFGTFGRPGADILSGHWVGIFSDPTIQAGVLELAFWGVPALLAVHTVAGWILFSIIVGSLFSIAIAAVVERLLRPITRDWSIPLAITVATFAAMSGLLTQATSSGHPAEIAIPVLWIMAAALARQGRAGAAAGMMAATAGWELWGLLGVPVLLLAPRIDLRVIGRSALAGIVVLCLLFLPFALIGPFDMFSFAWPVRDNTLAHLLFPSEKTFPWPLRLTQGVLSVSGGVAAAVLSRRSAHAAWLVPLVVCAIRLFTDPVLAPYYAVPPLLMALIGAVFAIAQRQPVIFVLCVVMVNLMIDTALSVVTGGILVIVVAATSLLVVRASRAEERLPSVAKSAA